MAACASFPVKLYDMLEDADRKNFAHIISWLPTGTAFKIHNPRAFVDRILPKYFRQQTQYKSFSRQLNLYEFKFIKEDTADDPSCSPPQCENAGGYFHPMFSRGKRNECRHVKRRKKKRRSWTDLEFLPQFSHSNTAVPVLLPHSNALYFATGNTGKSVLIEEKETNYESSRTPLKLQLDDYLVDTQGSLAPLFSSPLRTSSQQEVGLYGTIAEPIQSTQLDGQNIHSHYVPCLKPYELETLLDTNESLQQTSLLSSFSEQSAANCSANVVSTTSSVKSNSLDACQDHETSPGSSDSAVYEEQELHLLEYAKRASCQFLVQVDHSAENIGRQHHAL